MSSRHIDLAFLALILAPVLSGCQKDIDYKATMDTAEECCKSYSDIQYLELNFKKALNQDIGDGNSPAMNFPEGKSFFMAVQLPPFNAPFEVQIDSIPQYNKLFVPTVLLLNEQFEITRQIDDSAFEYSNGNSSYDFFVNEEDRMNRYMILYTRSNIIGKENESVTTNQTIIPIYAAGYIVYYTDHSEVNNKIINARGGRLRIKLKEYKLRNINDDPNITNNQDF